MLLDMVGLEAVQDRPVGEYSKGMQRRIGLAQSLINDPQLLILDEPCLGLDDMNRQLVLALIEKICAESETAVVYVNHHASDRIKGINHYLALDHRG